MKVKSFLLFMLILLGASQSAKSQDENYSKEETFIKQAIENYFQGFKDNNLEIMNKAIHSKAKWISPSKNGRLYEITQEQRAKLIKEQARRNMPRPQGTMRILSIDVTGNSASAKAEIEFQLAVVTEYLLLLKFGNEWKIVSGITYGKQKK